MLDFIRGIVRPTLTWIGFIAVIVMIFLELPIPDWFQSMVALMIGFWFGQRMNGNNSPLGK